MSVPTITVDLITDYNLIKMTWGAHIDEQDIILAFRAITSILKKSGSAVNVLVDITSNPQFSMQTLFSEALSGPFKYPQLGMWAVVGTSRAAHIVSNVLNRLSSDQKVIRFSTQAEALDYLSAQSSRGIG